MLGMGVDLPTRFGVVQHSDARFPARLSDLAVPPRALWVAGGVPGDHGRSIAIVGSRAATTAATSRVFQLAADLAAAGWAVISGGALGIDAAAHRGTLATKGPTYAVLGCGIDVVYPDRHARLFDEIVAAGGGLLSEYAPGTPPRPGQFPARNRLVAALASAIVVGESRTGSGALITARLAIGLGRTLLAIPGSAGTDALLSRGAAVAVESADDVLEALAGRPVRAPAVPAPFDNLLRALGDGPVAADALAGRLGLSLAETLGLLCEAELRGFVGRLAGAKFEARIKSRFEASRGH